MTKAFGALTIQEIEKTLASTDVLLALTPVLVTTLSAVRHSWGHETQRYHSGMEFFRDPIRAKSSAESLRRAGTSFLVDEVPALQLDGMNSSTVLMSLNAVGPFEDWRDEFSAEWAKILAAGVGVRTAVLTLGRSVTSASEAAHRGIVVLNATNSIDLPKLAMGSEIRTWASWPAKPKLDWYEKQELSYRGTGALEVAELFNSQSLEAGLDGVSILTRESVGLPKPKGPNLSVVT